MAVAVGGGVQYESYTYVKTDPNDPRVLTDQDSVSATFEARLSGRWHAVPDVVSLRIRTTAFVFGVTRDTFSARRATATQSAAASDVIASSRQIEVSTRICVEIDALAALGIVPGLFGGADFVSVHGEGASAATFVPSVGGVLTKSIL